MKALINTFEGTQKDQVVLSEQELIWDSGAGFDVVTAKRISCLFNGSGLDCKLKTGESKGRVIPLNSKELLVFSLERRSKMRRKYDAC